MLLTLYKQKKKVQFYLVDVLSSMCIIHYMTSFSNKSDNHDSLKSKNENCENEGTYAIYLQ